VQDAVLALVVWQQNTNLFTSALAAESQQFLLHGHAGLAIHTYASTSYESRTILWFCAVPSARRFDVLKKIREPACMISNVNVFGGSSNNVQDLSVTFLEHEGGAVLEV